MPSFNPQIVFIGTIVVLVIATVAIVFAFMGQKADDRLRAAFDRVVRSQGYSPVHRVPDQAISVLETCGIGQMHGTSSCIRYCWRANGGGLPAWFAVFIPRLIDPPNDNNTLLCFFASSKIGFRLKVFGDHRRIPSSPLEGGSKRAALHGGRTAKYECAPHDREHCAKAVAVAEIVARCAGPGGTRPDVLASESWVCVVGPRLSLLEASSDEEIVRFVEVARCIATVVSDHADAVPVAAIATSDSNKL